MGASIVLSVSGRDRPWGTEAGIMKHEGEVVRLRATAARQNSVRTAAAGMPRCGKLAI